MIVMMFILLSTLVFAQTISDNLEELEEFRDNPTIEGFSKLTQANQILYIQELTFEEETDLAIAREYFVNPTNVNANKQTFSKFMGQQGVSLVVEEGTGVVNFDNGGALTGTDCMIDNIYKFASSNLQIQIDKEGKIHLVEINTPADSSVTREWELKGNVRVSENDPSAPTAYPLLTLEEGEVNSVAIKGGSFYLKGGKIIGTVKEIKGITFSEPTLIDFSPRDNLLTTHNAKVDQIDPKTDLTLYGENIILPQKNKINSGSLTFKEGRITAVGSNSDVIVEGFNHITSNADLRLFYADDNPELRSLQEKEDKELEELRKRYKVDKDSEAIEAEIAEKRASVDTLNAQAAQITRKIKQIAQEPESAMYTASLGTSGGRLPKEERLRRLLQEQAGLYENIDKAQQELESSTNRYLPFLLARDVVQKKYQQQRNALYDQFIPSIKPQGANYFIYGTERIWLGGNGFTSKTEEDNRVFPEFKKHNEEGITRTSLGRLEFKPQNGNLDVQKVSRDGQPLALYTKMDGSGEIINGKWSLIADGNNIYGRTILEESADEHLVSSDMRFEYSSNEGINKVYDLDVDTTYAEYLTDAGREALNEEMIQLTKEVDAIRAELNSEQKEQISEYEILESELEALYGITSFSRSTNSLLYWQGQLARALKNPAKGNQDSPEQKKIVASINAKIKSITEKINVLQAKKSQMERDPKIREYRGKTQRLSEVTLALSEETGTKKTGAFGQVITSNNGDAQLSYQEYIEGFGVKKNDYVKRHTEENYVQSAGITVGGSLLGVPIIQESNRDSLVLDIVAPSQECIDTQFRLAYEYAMATGTDICYNNGQTCLRDPQFGRSNNPKDPQRLRFIKGWMGSQGVRHYIRGTTKQKEDPTKWTHDVQLVSPSDLQPGDVIITKGGTHATGVKEVIEIPQADGTVKKYYRTYAGSQPTIDAHIYDTLQSVPQLEGEMRTGMTLAIYRWKFKGEAAPSPAPEATPTAPSVSPPSSTTPPVSTPDSITPQKSTPVIVNVPKPLPTSLPNNAKSGEELFGKSARCPTCRYWPEGDTFKAVDRYGNEYKLNNEKIKHLKKVKDKFNY